MLEFFTAGVAGSVLVVIVMGLVTAGVVFFAEVLSVYERIRFALDKSQRHNITWRTLVWMPVRLYVIIIIPQVFYIFFTEIIKFG